VAGHQVPKGAAWAWRLCGASPNCMALVSKWKIWKPVAQLVAQLLVL
jgi:hypothetical protein